MRHSGTYIGVTQGDKIIPYRVNDAEGLGAGYARLRCHEVGSLDMSTLDLCSNGIIIDRPHIGFGVTSMASVSAITNRRIKSVVYYSNSPSRQIKRSLPHLGRLNAKTIHPLHAVYDELQLGNVGTNSADERLTVSWWFNNDYPTLDEAISMIKNTKAVAYPFHKDAAVTLTARGGLGILYRTKIVGSIVNGDPVIAPQYSYLNDRLSEVL